MKKVLLVLTGLCAVYLLWDVLFVDSVVIVNGAPVAGLWGSLAGGGLSLVAAALMFVLFVVMMVIFAGAGLLVISAVVILMSLWLFPVFAPLLVLIMVVWMLKKASKND